MPFSDEQEIAFIQKILGLWSGKLNETLSYSDIITKCTSLGLKERTVAKYLRILSGGELLHGVSVKALDKIEKPGHPVIYKPVSPEVHQRVMSIQRISRVCNMDILLSQRMDELIHKKFNETVDLFNENARFRDPESPDGIHPRKLEKIDEKSIELIETLKKSLTTDAFDERIVVEDIYGVLWQGISDLVSAYMNLWSLTQGYGSQKRMARRLNSLKEELEKIQKDDPAAY